MNDLSTKQIKESDRLRDNIKKSAIENEIEKQTEYTKKRDKVLDNLTPLGNLTSKNTKEKKTKEQKDLEKLQKRKCELFIRMYNECYNIDNEKYQEKVIKSFAENEIISNMWIGKKYDNITFDLAIDMAKSMAEKPKKENKIKAKIVEIKKEKSKPKELNAWQLIGNGIKKALSYNNPSNKCCICQKVLKSKRKFKKHMAICNKQIEKRIIKENKLIHAKKPNSKKKRKKLKKNHSKFYDNDNGLTAQRGWRPQRLRTFSDNYVEGDF